MSYVQLSQPALDYHPCQYPGSPMTFRGPQAEMEAPFVLCLGGSETFGKFSPDPFPDRLADRLGRRVVNMGAMNAGVDLFLQDRAVRDAMTRAEKVVLQIPGAANMSNRFFRVHPRRNDRFLKASSKLVAIFREVDFTEFHFTRHMLHALKSTCEERFSLVVQELQTAWQARMSQLLATIKAPVHLLWLSHREMADRSAEDHDMGYDPLFVTAEMVREIEPLAESLTACIWPEDARRPAERGLMFAEAEEGAARLMPGPADHERVSQALARVLG